MKTTRRAIASAVAIVLSLGGCAATPDRFRENPSALNDTTVCRTLKSSAAQADPSFEYDVRRELKRRALDENACDNVIRDQNLAVGAAAILGAILVAASRNGGGGGSYSQYDTDWDWDQFHNQYRQLVWACRGVQTGQFANSYRCAGKSQTDWRWPQK